MERTEDEEQKYPLCPGTRCRAVFKFDGTYTHYPLTCITNWLNSISMTVMVTVLRQSLHITKISPYTDIYPSAFLA